MSFIIPSILEKTEKEFITRLNALRPHFYRAQVDVLNGSMFNNTSFADPWVIDGLVHEMRFEIHLMVAMDSYDVSIWDRPWVEKIIFHAEASSHPEEIIATLRKFEGKKIFLALNPETDPGDIKYLNLVDGVQFMTIHPGRSGTPFMPQILDTILKFHTRHPKIPLEADGGVNNETLLPLLTAGIDEVVVGSFLANDRVEERMMELLSIEVSFDRTKTK